MSSLCGPSSALSSLQKHASADRTLQQGFRGSSSSFSSFQTFRNTAGNDNGRFENDFQRFSSTPQGPIQQLPPPNTHPAAFHSAHQPLTDGWTGDFQQLHIAQYPATGPQIQAFHKSSPMVAANWHEEFMRQGSAIQHLHTQDVNIGYSSSYAPKFTGSRLDYMDASQLNVGIGDGMAHENQTLADQFDEAAFEKAFADAKATLDSQSEAIAASSVAQVGTLVEEEPEVKKEEDKEDDPDELARTAAQLLESLSENKSKKFQDSTFLALMRRLRDHEVTVEGDKMVELPLDAELSSAELRSVAILQSNDGTWVVIPSGHSGVDELKLGRIVAHGSL
ncbi:hypothetical protein RUND412_011399 [Rhizina undulata]